VEAATAAAAAVPGGSVSPGGDVTVMGEGCRVTVAPDWWSEGWARPLLGKVCTVVERIDQQGDVDRVHKYLIEVEGEEGVAPEAEAGEGEDGGEAGAGGNGKRRLLVLAKGIREYDERRTDHLHHLALMKLQHHGSVHEAEALFHRALAIDPQHCDSMAALALLVHSKKRDPDAAEEILEKSLAINPRWVSLSPIVGLFVPHSRSLLTLRRYLRSPSSSTHGGSLCPP